jgi:hypothetical protein
MITPRNLCDAVDLIVVLSKVILGLSMGHVVLPQLRAGIFKN